MTEEKSKALDYLENIIGSMRDCSFKCKEFCILICSAFLTIYATVQNTPKLMIILCVPVIFLFWLIDSSYLSKEKFFRKQYLKIVNTNYKENDCSPLEFSKDENETKGEKAKRFFGSMFCSFATVPIYLSLLAAALTFGIIVLL